MDYLQHFDRVKIYYDNGQEMVTKALHDAVEYALAKEAIVYRDATPKDYRFLQVADYLCTLELEALKRAEGEASKTSLLFFGERRRFEKDFLRKLRKKRL